MVARMYYPLSSHQTQLSSLGLNPCHDVIVLNVTAENVQCASNGQIDLSRARFFM